ncbi:MAG: hypothetical protein AAFY69_15580 [Pseudomonadota bacterium]
MGTLRPLVIILSLVVLGVVALRLYDPPQEPSPPADIEADQAPVASTTPVEASTRTAQASATLPAATQADAIPTAEQPAPETLQTIRSLGPDVEQALILADKGMRFEMTRTLLDDAHFDELVEALDSDLVGLELQNELLALFYAKAPADTVAVDRLACGEKICVLRVYGPSQEALEAYVETVSGASEGRVLSRNTHDRIDAPGWIERRVIFATDQTANGFVIENPGGRESPVQR